MKKPLLGLALTCSTLAVLTLARGARAAETGAEKTGEAPEPSGLELALKLGLATNPVSGASSNPLGPGLGGRIGGSYRGFYAGLDVMSYLGTGGASYGPGAGVSVHALLVGVDVGYGVTVFDQVLTIRPQIGLGALFAPVNTEGIAFPGIGGGSNAYIEPAIALLASRGRFLVGLDVGILAVPGVHNGSGAGSTSYDFASLTGTVEIGARF